MASNEAWTPAQRSIVIASFLGWMLDAFDFFLMVFVLKRIAGDFGTDVKSITEAIFLTLAMRPVGAFLFGRLADHYGRRPALMASVLLYSGMELASAFAPSLRAFLILRALYGIAMGGEWGVGASLAFESVPVRSRGMVSGMLQAGYPTGYLLASVVFGLLFEHIGWRGMFMVGAAPALLVLYIRSKVPESATWTASQAAPKARSLLASLSGHWLLALYAIALMTCFNFFSHGTQDIYPRYLQSEHHIVGFKLSTIVVIYNIGAMLGGIAFGSVSQRIGRRWAIGLAAALSLPLLPLWAFSVQPVWIGLGAFLMQFCVQGAWGVIPVHLNELSPPSIRGTFPGFTYQIGNFLAALNLPLQSGIAESLGGDYRWPLVGVAGTAAVLIIGLMAFGRESKDVRMGAFGSTEPRSV